MFRIITVFLIVFLLLLGCNPTANEYNRDPIKFTISKNFSQKEVFEIIIASLLSLGYSIDGEPQEGKVSASLNKKSLSTKVTLTYKENKIVILNESYRTYDMPMEFGKNSKREQFKTVPYSWLINIKKAIEKEENKRFNEQKIKSYTK